MSIAKVKIAYYSQPDKRRLATQYKLFAALQQTYLSGAPISSVHVTALCQAAHLTRQTFYRHYHEIGDVVVDNTILLANQFLKRVDNHLNADHLAAAFMVDLFQANQTAIAMIFWAHEEEQVVALISQDMQRVNNYNGTTSKATAFKLELFARAIISFAKTMTRHPQMTRDNLIEIYRQTVPAPQAIFQIE